MNRIIYPFERGLKHVELDLVLIAVHYWAAAN